MIQYIFLISFNESEPFIYCGETKNGRWVCQMRMVDKNILVGMVDENVWHQMGMVGGRLVGIKWEWLVELVT